MDFTTGAGEPVKLNKEKVKEDSEKGRFCAVKNMICFNSDCEGPYTSISKDDGGCSKFDKETKECKLTKTDIIKHRKKWAERMRILGEKQYELLFEEGFDKNILKKELNEDFIESAEEKHDKGVLEKMMRESEEDALQELCEKC